MVNEIDWLNIGVCLGMLLGVSVQTLIEGILSYINERRIIRQLPETSKEFQIQFNRFRKQLL